MNSKSKIYIQNRLQYFGTKYIMTYFLKSILLQLIQTTYMIFEIFLTQMSNIQQHDKTLMNMYSVHKFYEQIIEEMHQILKSEKKESYMLKQWDDQKAKLFIHAIQHYLNNQPSFFNKAIQKYSNHQAQAIIPYKRKKKKNNANTPNQSKSVVSNQSKNKKKAPSVVTNQQESKKQPVSATKNTQNIKLQYSLDSKVPESASKTSANLKSEQKQQKNSITGERYVQSKLKKQQKVEQNDIDDLQRYYENNQFIPIGQKSEDDKKSIKSSVKNESICNDQQEEASSQSSEQQSLGKYVQRAATKTNAMIFGNFSTRQLRRKAKQQKIDLQLRNCFVKMFRNGRDGFFQSMTLSLYKQQKHEVNIIDPSNHSTCINCSCANGNCVNANCSNGNRNDGVYNTASQNVTTNDEERK